MWCGNSAHNIGTQENLQSKYTINLNDIPLCVHVKEVASMHVPARTGIFNHEKWTRLAEEGLTEIKLDMNVKMSET